MEERAASSMEERELTWVDPKSIKYSQACISREFRRKILKKHTGEAISYAGALRDLNRPLALKTAVEQLKAGRLKVTDFPPIRVVPHQSLLYTLDNRRLWVFKAFGASEIPVLLQHEADKEFFQKLSREGGGDSVTFITPDDAKEYKMNRTLLSVVLKWSLDDTLNEYLYVNKVQPIPMRFDSLSKYLESFKEPLVEETRAQLQQSFEEIKAASYIPLKRVEEGNTKQDLDALNLKTFMLLRDPLKPIVNRGNKGKPSWKPKPTDIILLTNKVPLSECIELKRFGVHYTLGILKGSRENDDNVLSATVYAPSESPEYKWLCEPGKPGNEFFAVQMGNLATGKRIDEALFRADNDRCQRFPILNSLLYSQPDGDMGTSDRSKVPLHYTMDKEELVDSYCEYRGLNKSQATAVKTSINGLLLEVKPRIRLIQGPPGTGKTATLATLLSILSSFKQRTLVCAPTNIAISEVILRFLKFFTVKNQSHLFGQFCAEGEENTVRRGDMILIGNEDRFDLEGPLEQLFVEHRIDRLIRALSPSSGWRASTWALVEFLKSASLQYETSKETDQIKSSFMEFFRKRLELRAKEFLGHCHVLCNDLPSRYLPASCFTVLEKYSKMVISFLDYITRSKFKEVDVRMFFQESSTNKTSAFAEAVYGLQDALTAMTNDVALRDVPIQSSREWIQQECIEHAWLVFSTVSSAGRHILLNSKPFDCVIIDEASQCVEAATVVVTSMKGVKQMVLVGDQMQLPATVISQVALRCDYGRSLFERLQSLGHPVHLLNVQYRMHSAISVFPNAQFYGGKVQDGDNVLKGRYNGEPCQQIFSGPYQFINVRDGREQRDEGQAKSWKNLLEAEIVILLISRIQEACSKARMKNLSVGVISPYQSQVENLERRLSRYNAMDDITVEVKSVDGFQGREKDIIIFSTVRANRDGNIGFLQDHRRLNVAITRAKYCMWIVGNASTLKSKDAVWKALIEDAKQRKCIVEPGSDPEMTKIVKRVTHELNQLAELLDSNSGLFNGTLWKVLFAKEMKTKITRIKSLQTRQLLLNSMLNLANGRRFPYLKSTELTSARFRNLIQVYPVADYFLVWTIDVENGRQIIKVWNAVQNSELGVLVRRLEGGFSMWTDEYLKRCAEKRVHTSKKGLVFPAKWNSDDSFVKYKSLKPLSGTSVEADVDIKPLLEDSGVDDSVLLMKFYSLSSGIAHQLLTASDGSQLSLPFEVNEQEAAIIQYPSSSFIIGRSGTGKTTVITTKLLQRELEFWIATNGTATGNGEDEGTSEPEATSFLKQALITLSPKLCAAVKHNISKTRRSMQQAEGGLVEADDSDDVFEEMMLDDEAEARLMGAIPDNFMTIPRDCYPLVITFRKMLTMLDGSISRSYFLSNPEDPKEDAAMRMNGLEIKDEKETADNEEFVDANTDLDGEEDEDFSDVEEEENLSEDDNDMGNESSLDERKSGKWEGTEVEFEQFNSVYWPHFDSKLTKNLDPSLVYTEIMSHIKGSLAALQSPYGRLSREDYVAMAERRSSLYSEQQRDNIYSLFLKYEKRKRENWEFDVADLVTHLYLELKSGGFLGEKMHFLYVDEVQDFTQAQIALFKFICSNLESGFVFAGDTAQTIARGVGFRFEDVRRLYYEEFLGRESECAISQGSQLRVPDLFQLTMNFRTHMGVVSIADSVVKLLHHFFPSAIDKLDEERSLLQGEVPIFLKTAENDGLVTSLFDKGGTAGGGGCEFGAEQVILVRDRKMKHVIGDRGLVLSVHECKGLEFQDVLLYNFFADSPLRNKWRVIYAFMVEQGSATNLTFPCFDVKHHNLLCSELKQLYVMLTRARQRLWIYDESIENHQPMLDYWMASGFVRVEQLDAAALAEELRGKSSPEDWNKRGVKMFNEHHYDAAKLCFEKAGDTAKAQHAKAASLQQEAEKLQVTNPKKAAGILQEAAELYLSIDKGETAAKCYHKIRKFKKAGLIYRDVCNPPNLEAAGECFTEAKCWQEAAFAYSRISAIKCLQSCSRGKLLDMGLFFIKEWEQRKDNKPAFNTAREKSDFEGAKTEFLKKAATHYHQGKNVEEMMKFVLVFPTLTMRRSFLKRRDYNDQLQFIEEAAGNYQKAAELAEAHGNLKDAAKLFERAGSISLAVEKLLHIASMELLWKDDNKGWPRLLTPEVIRVLEHAQSLVTKNESAIGAALTCELQILQYVSCTKIQIYKKNYEQSRMLKVMRLQLLSSYLLLQELAKTINREGFGHILLPDSNPGLLREQISDLAEVWDNWSSCIVSSIHALDRLQKGRGREEDEPILQCIYSYLGVARDSQPHTIVVEYSKAHWLADSSISASTSGKINQLSVQEFAGLAIQFFSAQLLETADLLSEKVFFTVAESIKHMARMSTVYVHVLLLRFKVLWLVLDANTCDGRKKVELKPKIIEVASQIYNLLFIDMPFHSMKEVHFIRESPDILQVFDSLAKDLSPEAVNPDKYDQLGKLVTLQPFMGNDWVLGDAFQNMNKNLERSPKNNLKVRLWNGSQSQHNAVLKSAVDKHHCFYWIERIKWFMSSLRDMHSGAVLISPLVFLALFERGVVATCAWSTHLKSMLVTESMALCYMAGKHYEPYYSMLLTSTCNSGCRYSKGVLDDATQLILTLFFDVLQLENWFKLSPGLNKAMYLPLVVLRLINLLLTICINTDNGQIHKKVIQGLTTLFEKKSPVLAKLPSYFYEELRKPFIYHRKPPISKLARVFSSAMELLGDPVIMLRNIASLPHAKMSWHSDAEKNFKLRVQKYGPQTFSLGDVEQKTSPNANKTVKEKASTENDKEDEGDNFFDWEKFIKDDEGAQENDFPSEILEASQDNIPEKTMSKDELLDSFGSGLAKPEPMMSESVILEDDTRLSRACVQQLKGLLAAARERILIPLTPVESYEREARSVFIRKGITDKVYIDLFNSKACSLLVDVDEQLMKLNKALGLIKGECEGLDDEGDLLDDFNDHKDKLEEHKEDLNPKCIKHEDMDQFWLHETIETVKTSLGDCQNKLQGSLKKVFKAAGEVVDGLAPPTSKSTPAQKSPQPNKGKKNKPKKKTKKRR